jgi:hypothetical protein
MAEVSVSGEIDASVEKLWQCVAAFGDVSWMKGVSKVEVKGEGPGMVRVIHAGGGEPIHEVLESLDPGSRCLGYTITQNNPMPVSDYHATCSVVDLGDGRSRLDWGCRFEPKGADEAVVRASIEGLYGMLIGWLKESVEQG